MVVQWQNRFWKLNFQVSILVLKFDVWLDNLCYKWLLFPRLSFVRLGKFWLWMGLYNFDLWDWGWLNDNFGSICYILDFGFDHFFTGCFTGNSFAKICWLGWTISGAGLGPFLSIPNLAPKSRPAGLLASSPVAAFAPPGLRIGMKGKLSLLAAFEASYRSGLLKLGLFIITPPI